VSCQLALREAAHGNPIPPSLGCERTHVPCCWAGAAYKRSIPLQACIFSVVQGSSPASVTWRFGGSVLQRCLRFTPSSNLCLAEIELRTLCTSIWVPALPASPPNRFGSVPEIFLTTRQNRNMFPKNFGAWQIPRSRLKSRTNIPKANFPPKSKSAQTALNSSKLPTSLSNCGAIQFFLQNRAKEFLFIRGLLCLGHRKLDNLSRQTSLRSQTIEMRILFTTEWSQQQQRTKKTKYLS
jgi:hypothetical protein